MRLTLRTLLAYMDDMLEPSEHEELSQKIEASDFATELIHRSRDAVRRLRLGAPDVLADDSADVLDADPAMDANAVAEYLDNVLPPEQVAEFERSCLDHGTVADMHLAEVTSCHHVLTMVLGEPADIEPKTRRRMYELPLRVQGGPKLRIEEAHTPINDAPPAPQVDAATPQVQRPEPVVLKPSAPSDEREEAIPDYLRVASAHQRRGRRLLTMGVLAILGGLTVYLFLGALEPVEVPEEVAKATAENDLDLDHLVEVGEPTNVGETADLEEADTGAAAPTADSGEAPAFVPGGSEDAASEPPPFEPGVTGQPTSEYSSKVPAAETPANETPADTESATPEGESLRLPGLDSMPGLTVPGVGVMGKEIDEGIEEEAIEQRDTELLDELSPGVDFIPGMDQARATSEPGLDADDLTIGPALGTDMSGDADTDSAETQIADTLGVPTVEEEDATPPMPPKPQGPTQLGTYLGKNDILVRLNPSTGQWIRLPEKTVITSGDTVMALPKYRTQILLGNTNVYLSGGTRISLPQQELAPDGDEMGLDLELEYGRMILTPGADGSQVTMKVGSIERSFDLNNLAYLAVDAHRLFVPGSDFEHGDAPVEINWYLTTGSVEWTDESGQAETIQGPAAWVTSTSGDSLPRGISTMPHWIDDDEVSRLDYRARDRLLTELQVGQPVRTRLEELNSRSNPNRELRNLSSEASLHVGEFEPMVRALNDSDQKPYWDKDIEAMHQALARGGDNASKLEEAFLQLRGAQDGADLVRMVRGFTPDQIGTNSTEVKQGVVLELIRWLESPSLDYRVLASYNLDQIKGTKNLKGYSPDELQRSRDKAVMRIRQLLENNEFLTP